MNLKYRRRKKRITNEGERFEDIHRRGAERFGWNWFDINRFIADVFQEFYFPDELVRDRLMLSMIAWKILVNITPAPESAVHRGVEL